jgi:16S rRNA (cytosine1402-N4)-methyltransferase
LLSEQTLFFHKSVLTKQVISYLNPQPGKRYLDVTFGSGGHTRALLEKEPDCSVIALDWDTVAIERYGQPLKEEFGDRLALVWGNFALVQRILAKIGVDAVDGIVADFGTSQVQIKERPGFSLYQDLPLDMRMSPAHQKVTAAELLNKSTEQKLREIFWELGEERYAKQIAQAIVQERSHKKFKTTGQLTALVERTVGGYGKQEHKKRFVHPATRVFQALRIYVNKELDNITSFLTAGARLLSPGGRMVCISFHSLEDRLVKQFFKQQEKEQMLRIVTPQIITAEDDELQANPSSRSARLRVAERV